MHWIKWLPFSYTVYLYLNWLEGVLEHDTLLRSHRRQNNLKSNLFTSIGRPRECAIGYETIGMQQSVITTRRNFLYGPIEEKSTEWGRRWSKNNVIIGIWCSCSYASEVVGPRIVSTSCYCQTDFCATISRRNPCDRHNVQLRWPNAGIVNVVRTSLRFRWHHHQGWHDQQLNANEFHLLKIRNWRF